MSMSNYIACPVTVVFILSSVCFFIFLLFSKSEYFSNFSCFILTHHSAFCPPSSDNLITFIYSERITIWLDFSFGILRSLVRYSYWRFRTSINPVFKFHSDLDGLTFQNGTDMLSRNAGQNTTLRCVNTKKTQISFTRRPKPEVTLRRSISIDSLHHCTYDDIKGMDRAVILTEHKLRVHSHRQKYTVRYYVLTHWGRVTQICVFTLQLCKTDDANLRF